ncbi:lytic polysaccharide monooxygenase [Hypholoma sublateritium FD-334 SS-4]|uniref:lytic cellulose monooxygenase (C4-dehydrogenating) n=1 Tax=Hypholoma sublateritium (strain FD-334 SS-4) TaxID=945553 RepID=A0A0D2M3B5_HYPSF|nr:lytic polysaccharide monooxygenase [Hypholoma sublateritium FD-334 SS-4]
MKSTSLLIPLFGAACVSAHGFLATVTINGKSYTGNVPSGTTNPSIIRQVSTPDPNKGASNPALTCGPNATDASLIGTANPGDALTFSWKGADLSNWPHNTGPMLTYMASCGSTTCDKFDDTQAKWFKISEDGKTPGDNSTWLQQRLMNGGVANSTIPSNLAPGNYLLRHEIIALHLATSLGGAEFYPACAQITVGGSQTGAPSASDLVSIPGAYSDNDPGIFDPNVFTPDAPYVFPGPPIASFIAGSSSTASTTGAASPTTTGAAAASSATTGKTCKIQKRAVSNDEVDIFVVRPRHLSRIMRRLAESMY